MATDVAMRRIRDEQGVEWAVYEIVRQARLGREGRIADVLPPTYANGWLVFESTSEKRRLAPFPKDWETLPAATLQSLFKVAIPARTSGRVNAPRFEDALHAEEEDLRDKR